MNIYDYEQAFGASDKTGRPMREAVRKWFDLYYGTTATRESDPSQRVACAVVSKLTRTVFGEYTATAGDPVTEALLTELNACRKEALQQMLVGGECYLKPWVEGDKFRFLVIPRSNILVFARDPAGMPTDVGTVERSTQGRFYYTLLERRRLDGEGHLVIENRLYQAKMPDSLGSPVPLTAHRDYENLPERYRFPKPLGGIGLVRLKSPAINCVDGSREGVSIYAPAVGLIDLIDRNEAQLSGEFRRGMSRLVVSADMLGQDSDDVFVGLDEDPDRVGITIFSPHLREGSYLARKQEYLRNVESVIGLRRGMLSDANIEDRTATEITSSAGDYNLTVLDLQEAWQTALRQTLTLCRALAALYRLPVPNADAVVDWGNGVLHDESALWQEYLQMVREGLIAPEVALGWRFGMPHGTGPERQRIREKLMPEGGKE